MIDSDMKKITNLLYMLAVLLAWLRATTFWTSLLKIRLTRKRR